MGGKSIDLSSCVSLDELRAVGYEPAVDPEVYRNPVQQTRNHYAECLSVLAVLAEEKPKAVIVFLLSAAKKKTTAEISACTGMSVRTVDRTLAWIRKRKATIIGA